MNGAAGSAEEVCSRIDRMRHCTARHRTDRTIAGAVNRHHGERGRLLEAAVAYFAMLGVRIERVMTDNGSCYRSKSFRAACKRLGLRRIFTKPYPPRTNGRPSASSKQRCANGPTLGPVKTRTSDQQS
jgi:transposase InsO family protein